MKVKDFKELDNEDLLGRDPVPANKDLLTSDLAEKVVLVTGVGGGYWRRAVLVNRGRKAALASPAGSQRVRLVRNSSGVAGFELGQ